MGAAENAYKPMLHPYKIPRNQPMALSGNGPVSLASSSTENFGSGSGPLRQGSLRGLPNDVTGHRVTSSSSNSTTPNYKYEAERLRTYDTWPLTYMRKSSMAEAGFYYTKKSDLVKCAFCGIEIGKWEEGDDPMRDHLRWKPHCPFLKKANDGNVPLGQESNTPQSQKGYDTCGPYGIVVRKHSGPENELCESSLEHLGVNKATPPLHKAYITCETRKKSFDHWPVSMKQKPDVLSDAGFFYTGKGDQTICFHCGGGLKDWVETDDPWEEHATWFPKCNFVLLRKGKAFVDLQANKSNSNTQEKLEIASNGNVVQVTAPAVEPVMEPVSMEFERKDNDARLCKICCVEELGVVFLPCGHMVACHKCAPSISACPVCRKPFSATVRAYLP